MKPKHRPSYLVGNHRFAALAHRGFSLDGLENSLAAFAAARDLGFEYVETDAHATADGVAVALHDARLDRTTDASGLVAELPWNQVARARIGGVEPVPRLDDLLGGLPGLKVNIDIKADPAIGPVVAAIERTAAWDRVCVTSFSTRRRRRAVSLLSRPVVTSPGVQEMTAFVLAARAKSRRGVARALADVDVLQVPVRQGPVTVVDAATVAAAHWAGKQVHVWTIDDPAEMERLIALGVDGIVTNRVDLLGGVMRRDGLW